MAFKLIFNEKDFLEISETQSKKLLSNTINSLNKTGRFGRTQLIQKLSDDFNVPKNIFRKKVVLLRASKGRPEITIKLFAPKGIPIALLKPKQKRILTSKGKRFQVSYIFKGQTITSDTAFFGNYNSRNKNVYERKGQKRLPITVARTPLFKEAELISTTKSYLHPILTDSFKQFFEDSFK